MLPLWQWLYNYVKLNENSFNSVEAMAMSAFSKSIKGENLVKLHYRVMSICQEVAIVMMNTFIKFDENSLSFVKVMAEICWNQAIFQTRAQGLKGTHLGTKFKYLRIFLKLWAKKLQGRRYLKVSLSWGRAGLGPGVIICRNLKADHLRNIPVKSDRNWLSCFWKEDI